MADIVKREEVLEVAQYFAQSGFFKDAADVAKAYVKIMAGRELGIAPMAAMTGISIIEGKPSIGANLMASRIRMMHYDYKVLELNSERCSIEFFNPQKESLGTSTFTIQDAQNIKVKKADGSSYPLTAKLNWQNYKPNMLFARCVSNGIKWFCPEVMQNVTVYTADELGNECDGDGNPVIEKFETPTKFPELDKPEESLGDIIGGQNTQDAEFTEEPPDYLKEPVPDTAQSAKPEAPALPTEIDSDEAIRIKLHGILQSRNAGTEPYPQLCADAKKDLKEFSTYKEFKPIDRLDWLKEARLRTVYGKAKDKYPAPKEDELFPIPKLKSEPMVYGDNAELPL